jgi:hypothetical protein
VTAQAYRQTVRQMVATGTLIDPGMVYQQLGILSQVPAEHQDGEGGYMEDYQVDDLERHPVGQPSPPPGRR